MSSTPTWYDLLDVEPTASTAEIRAAWKAAVADLDPTDRRFRRLSDAAAVLLDADRRAAYDAELAELEAEHTDEHAGEHPGEQADEHGDAPATEEPEEEGAERAPAARRRLPDLPGWVLIVVAVVTAAALTSAIVSVVRGGGGPDVVTAANKNETTSTLEADFGQPVKHDHATLIEEQAAGALSAAKEAVPAILSYDYRHLAADQQRAHAYMTSSYRKKYDELFAVIKDNAPTTKTIVKALTPVDTGVVRASGDRVQVLVFFDLPTTNAKNSKPIPYQQYATVTMVEQGGSWLVDDVQTKPGG
jgi:Mce-associated membrane protein